MVFSLTYTRPQRVDPQADRESLSDDQAEGSVKSGRSGCSAGIPDSLAFDNIINGGTCPVGLASCDFRMMLLIR